MQGIEKSLLYSRDKYRMINQLKTDSGILKKFDNRLKEEWNRKFNKIEKRRKFKTALKKIRKLLKGRKEI